MATITEDYCSRETYRLLIKKGFDGEVHTTFDKEGYTQPSITLQMAMKWLMEVHKLYVYTLYSEYLYGNKPFYWYIERLNEKPAVKRIVNTSTATEEYSYRIYEEATEAAIKYCLENLI